MYKRAVKDLMNPFIHMELNLKESQKYVKQGRTYTSTLMNLEILMWFVYEMELNSTHRQLGIFSACEREVLHTVQETTRLLDDIRKFASDLQKTGLSKERQDILDILVQTGESARNNAYYKFWDVRAEISERSRELLEHAAANDPRSLKDACKELKLREILENMRDAFSGDAGKMDEAVKRMESIETELALEDGYQEKVRDLMRFYDRDFGSYDKESILLFMSKDYSKKVVDSYKRIAGIIEKAVEKYERIENRIAEAEKNRCIKKKENRPSVKKRIEILQMRQPERSGKVAEKKREEVMR